MARKRVLRSSVGGIGLPGSAKNRRISLLGLASETLGWLVVVKFVGLVSIVLLEAP